MARPVEKLSLKRGRVDRRKVPVGQHHNLHLGLRRSAARHGCFTVLQGEAR